MFRELAATENIVCIKEASGDVRRITDLFNVLGDRYLIFAGLDDVALESFVLGCTGWISGLVDAFPRENRLRGRLQAGDLRRAAGDSTAGICRCSISTVHPSWCRTSSWPAPRWGYGTERVRAPRLPLAGEEREQALRIIRESAATRPE